VNFKQFSDHVIRPTLISLSTYTLKSYFSENAIALLLATMAQESQGEYLIQQGGPAVGLFQMEPATFHSLWKNEIEGKPIQNHLAKVCNFSRTPIAEDMIYNLKLAVAIARIFYWNIEEPLPSYRDAEGIWKYYKKYWNTEKGEATREQFMENYNRYCKGLYDGKENR
jgi:hypothetical protein